jgi:hypothetical protein
MGVTGMSKISFTFAGPKLDQKRIEAFESQLGTQLPDEYRQFLLEQNGGIPKPAFFSCDGRDSLDWVDYFCSLGEQLLQASEKSASNSLASAAKRDGAYVPSDALIIGYCCRDDLLLIFVRGRRRGQVHLKAIDEVEFEPPEVRAKTPEKAVYRVASSFSDFLDLLQEDQDA